MLRKVRTHNFQIKHRYSNAFERFNRLFLYTNISRNDIVIHSNFVSNELYSEQF